MAKLTPSRAAQTVLCSEFTFEFADTMLDVNGVLKDFKTVGSNVFEPINLPPRAIVVGGEVVTETAVTGSTAYNISVGDSVSATRYLGATDRTAAAIGSDFTQIMRARVMCFAALVAVAEATNYVNESVRTVDGGTIDPVDADAFDAAMTTKLTREVVTPGYASAVAVTVNRTDVIATTGQLRFQVRFRPLGYATTIAIDLGFSVTLGS